MKWAPKKRKLGSARIKPKYIPSLLNYFQYLTSKGEWLHYTRVRALETLEDWIAHPKTLFTTEEVQAAVVLAKYMPKGKDFDDEAKLGYLRLRKVLMLSRNYFEAKERRALKILQKHLNYKNYPPLRHWSKIDDRLAAFKATNPNESTVKLVNESLMIIHKWLEYNESLLYGIILNYLTKKGLRSGLVNSQFTTLNDIYNTMYIDAVTVLLSFRLDSHALPITYLVTTLYKRAGSNIFVDVPFSNEHEIVNLPSSNESGYTEFENYLLAGQT